MCPLTDYEANRRGSSIGPKFLMGTTWNTIRTTSNPIIGFCLENWALSNDTKQHTIRRDSWALEPNSILLGPSRAPSGPYMLIPVWVSIARFTFRPILCPHTDFEANHRVQPLGRNCWWALPETLLALGTSDLMIGFCLDKLSPFGWYTITCNPSVFLGSGAK